MKKQVQEWNGLCTIDWINLNLSLSPSSLCVCTKSGLHTKVKQDFVQVASKAWEIKVHDFLEQGKAPGIKWLGTGWGLSCKIKHIFNCSGYTNRSKMVSCKLSKYCFPDPPQVTFYRSSFYLTSCPTPTLPLSNSIKREQRNMWL